MIKEDFMFMLESKLRHIPITERNDILEDYKEHFIVGVEQGKSEEEICENLGDPIRIAKMYTATSFATQSTNKNSARSAIKAIIAAISLGFFNIIIGLPILILILTIVIVFFAIGISVFISGFALVLSSLFFPFISAAGAYIILTIIGGIGVMSLGVLMIIGTAYFTKYTFIGIAKYIKANIKIIGG